VGETATVAPPTLSVLEIMAHGQRLVWMFVEESASSAALACALPEIEAPLLLVATATLLPLNQLCTTGAACPISVVVSLAVLRLGSSIQLITLQQAKLDTRTQRMRRQGNIADE
jgi:hypothetical protein